MVEACAKVGRGQLAPFLGDLESPNLNFALREVDIDGATKPGCLSLSSLSLLPCHPTMCLPYPQVPLTFPCNGVSSGNGDVSRCKTARIFLFRSHRLSILVITNNPYTDCTQTQGKLSLGIEVRCNSKQGRVQHSWASWTNMDKCRPHRDKPARSGFTLKLSLSNAGYHNEHCYVHRTSFSIL